MRSRLLLAAVGTVAAVALIVAIVLASSSGESESTRDELARARPAGTATDSEPASTQPVGDPLAGREIFAAEGCGNCHTLAAAGSTGTIGPVLDSRRPRYDEFLEQVTAGGGGMPAYEEILSPQEIEDVVAFVIDSVRR